MFEESLVESTPLLRSHNRWPALLSLAAQLLAAALILTLPLLHPELVPAARSFPALLAPPVAPTPPPPVHVRMQLANTSSSTAAPQPATSRAPILRDLLHLSGPPVEAPTLGVIDLGNHNAALPAGINTASPGARVTVAPPGTNSSKTPLPISSGVSAGLLLAPIRPAYPSIAITTRTEGAVVIDAIISRSGSIESAHVLSGPTLLRQAALNAVRHARYRPFLLNGQPTEVQTTITIHFRLDS
ncbi:MAG TPA: energy transducer TonB [Acidobacteriaceae bacterium]|nr:energy transducer TonB [Acidobacteriaceae bacterium]